jgi:hypothetical protein
MIVRALDSNHDWEFGSGFNNYLSNNAALAQNIDTRLLMVLGDCFFATDQGIDWFNFMSSNSSNALSLAVQTTILNTPGVIGLVSSSFSVNMPNRTITMNYTVNTVYTGQQTAGAISLQSSFILTESGDILSTEQGGGLING